MILFHPPNSHNKIFSMLMLKFSHFSTDFAVPFIHHYELILNRKDFYLIKLTLFFRFVNNNFSLLCLVLTSPQNYLKKAVHVHATWGKKCTKILFSSEVSDIQKPDQLQVIELENVSGRRNLWNKLKLSLVHVWQNYNNTFDYLLKADDDTFVVMDNLMSRLSHMSPEKKFLLGHKQSDQVLVSSLYLIHMNEIKSDCCSRC